MLDLLQQVLEKAKSYGATAADAVLVDSSSVAVTRRLGKPEAVKRSEEADIGLRVFVGQRQAIVSSSDRSPETLAAMAQRAVDMAKSVPEDKYACIADPADLAKTFPDLDMFDATELSMEKMNDLADAAEQAAMAVKGITNSEGAECSMGSEKIYFAATNGFAGSYVSSGFSIGVSVIAGKDMEMEVEDEYDSAAHFADLDDPARIGREAGMRAVRALNPRKGPTKQVPVIFDRRLSGGLIGSLASAISGTSVARGTTILKDSMGKQVFARGITVVDDPFLPRGARSHPFDAEGIAPVKRNMIDDGMLTGWFLDLSSAKQLGLKTTGNASRGASSTPSPRPSNLYMQNGTLSVEELIRDIDEGFFVTQMMGSGANIVTGDYSRGAKGFWIEKGQIAYPVAEMTIAGNIRDMWLNATPANDLKLKYGIDAPTIRINSMTVAGS